MTFYVRDHRPSVADRPRPVNEDHGSRDDFGEARKLARDVAISRGFDPSKLHWVRYTVTTWGLLTGRDYTYIGIEQEG